MADSAKLLMLLDLLGGEPKKIAQRIAGEEYNTRSYIQVWHTLEEHYGGLNRATKDILHKLETFPKIAKFNKDNALEFLSLLLNILNKYANQGPGLINEGGVLSSLAKKIIPEHEVVTYFQKLAEYDRPDNFWSFTNLSNRRELLLILHQLTLRRHPNKVRPVQQWSSKMIQNMTPKIKIRVRVTGGSKTSQEKKKVH
jgi:hypothetical protein